MVDRADIQVYFIKVKSKGKIEVSSTPFPSIPMAEDFFRKKAIEYDSGRLLVDGETIYISTLGLIKEV